jgi:hypothetical protein
MEAIEMANITVVSAEFEGRMIGVYAVTKGAMTGKGVT